MKVEERLEQMAAHHETRAKSLRIAIEELLTEGRAVAVTRLNGKLRSASALRTETNGHDEPKAGKYKIKSKRTTPGKGRFIQFVTKYLAEHGPTMRDDLRALLQAQLGTDLRGMGTLTQQGIVTTKAGKYTLTKAGNKRAQEEENGKTAEPNSDAFPDAFPSAKRLTKAGQKALKAYAIARILESGGAMSLDQIMAATKDQYKINVSGQSVGAAHRRGYISKGPGWTPKNHVYVFAARPPLAFRES